MDVQKTMANLKRKKYQVSFFETAREAASYLDRCIDNKFVGFGDSETMLGMGLYEMLNKHNEVVDPMHCKEGENFFTTARKCLMTDVFLTSVNGLAETGEMVNIDGTGNRVAGSLVVMKRCILRWESIKLRQLGGGNIQGAEYRGTMNAARHGF